MEFAPGQFNESAHFWTMSPEAKNDFSIEGDVVWIRLTQGKCACVDLADWERAKEYRWCAHKMRYSFYANTHIGGRKAGRIVKLHHIVLQVDPSQLCDHEDRNGLDNRKSKLRVATGTQNMQNRIGWSKRCRFKGVKPYGASGKFRAIIVDNKINVHLGCFETEEEAARAYDKAASERFGEFARINFPSVVASQN